MDLLNAGQQLSGLDFWLAKHLGNYFQKPKI